LSRSALSRREAVLISDFQKIGWGSAEDARFSQGMTLTTLSVASPDATNLSVPSVTFARSSFSGQERIAVTAGLANRADQPATDVPVTLAVDGHDIETKRATIAARSSGSVTFAPFTAEANAHGVVRAGTDLFPADNTFNFVVAASEAISVAIVENGDRPDASFFLAKALSIGATPTFAVDVVPVGRATGAILDKRAVLVLNDTQFPSVAGGGALKRFVERGGGVLVITGDHSSWPTDAADLLPGKLGAPVDRLLGHSARLGYLDRSHQIFEVFQGPRSGDFSSAQVFRYRALVADPMSRVLARYDDGAVAMAERKTGAGRVIAWTSTLDDSGWTDLPKKPVFLPLVHQLVRYLARYEQTTAWMTVGQVVDLASSAAQIRGDRLVSTPAGQRMTQRAGSPGLLELDQQGFYEVRPAGATTGRPQAMAVNIDPMESDLTALDPNELVAAVTGHATQASEATAAATPLSPADAERRQALWWYLLLAGLILLTSETVISNRLSQKEKFL
jgi:hypothetical protein